MPYIYIYSSIDVPRPLTNDLWVFLFQTIDAEYVKWASPARTYVYVKAFIVNVNKYLKPFSRTTYQYCKIESRLKAFGLSVAAYPTPKEKIVVIIICIHYQPNSL